ncbi:cyanophycin synthetase [Clostridium sp.]|uniref:cyanophycin synthetase n=1 Tax=Clostridium sp. TaxID=1506 RepID=UPI003F2A8D6C
MKTIKSRVYEGRNIYSHKKCIRIDVDLEGYCEIPSKDIEDFNFNLVSMIPELNTHRCGIDEEGGFVKRLNEGTYLAHICEHIIIALQNKLGIEVVYGKAREIKDDLYYIVFQYEYAKTGLECSRLAIDIINALIEKRPINYDERIELIIDVLREEEIGPSTKAICNAAGEFNIPIMKLGDSNFYQLGYGKKAKIIEASIVEGTSCVAVDISCDKLLTKNLLEIQSIPVARGEKVYNIINLLKAGEKIGYPLVLKPQYGSKGNGVIVNIRDEKELVAAYEKLRNNFNDLILEEYHQGNDYRVCVVDYKVVAASLRRPPFIIGNGIDTVRSLINKLNSNPLRGFDHEKPLTKVKIDSEVEKYLFNQGASLQTILEKDKKVYLRQNANLSTGGDSIDVTDIISEENKDICIRAAKAIGLNICGIDICTSDISMPIKDNGIVMEVNAAPGLRMHENSNDNIRRPVGKEIIDMLYDGKPDNIPVISITGTNGKTTTTRIISHILSKMGYSIGMTSTEGIYINGRCIDKGDDTGVESAKAVLLNKDVDVAVLETARGGLIRKGLAYDLADIAVITNITEDHLGIDEINTMEDLCHVKSLVGEAVKESGYVVLNADDKWSMKIIDRIEKRKIYFSKDKENTFIKNNIANGEIAIYTDENWITIFNRGKYYNVIDINKIPITLDGNLEFNIENILAACGALVALEVDYCMIKNGLESYELNSTQNIGRFNIYNVNGVNVVLDYGHNIEGYKAALSSVNRINKGTLYGIIGIPGDRSDDMAIQIGKLSSELLDYVVIKEDRYKRGRKEGVVANLILEGIKKARGENKATVILDEVEALEEILLKANKDDTVIVFFEEIEPLIRVMNNINDKKDDFDRDNKLSV